MTKVPLNAPLLNASAECFLGHDAADAVQASNAHYFGSEEILLRRASPRKYNLLCHDTKTRVVVGGEGINEGDMIPSIVSEGAMEAFCAFLMHNRRRALYLHAESSAEPCGHTDYYEFSAWSQEPPPA
ncbi:hypothetical protein ACFPRE_04830 [Variovorax soli]